MIAGNLIAGEWSTTRAEPVENDPSTGRPLLTIPASGADDVHAAIAAAGAAAAGWKRTPAPDRGDLLFRAAAVVERRAAELAAGIVEEVGKPIREAKGEVARTAAIFRYFAGEGRRGGGRVLPSDGRGMTMTVREPRGVVGLITPWNFPLAIPAWKLAPALVAGNAIVLKPAEQSSRAVIELAKCLVEAGLPPGVLGVVCGDARAGRALVASDAIRALSFTGSLAAGRHIRAEAAKHGTALQLELGGKNCAIVLADADLARAATSVAVGAFGFAGQKCTATGIVLVERSIEGVFLKALEAARAAVRVGAPADPATECGPLIEEAAQQRARAHGARVHGSEGYFVEPTVLPGVALTDAIASDELFAPVLPVAAVDGLDEALRFAASSTTAVSAAIHTNSAASVLRFIQEMDAGVLAVNRVTTGLEVQAPFGGVKASAYGPKEQGPDAVDFYTETKTVYWTA